MCKMNVFFAGNIIHVDNPSAPFFFNFQTHHLDKISNVHLHLHPALTLDISQPRSQPCTPKPPLVSSLTPNTYAQCVRHVR